MNARVKLYLLNAVAASWLLAQFQEDFLAQKFNFYNVLH